MLVRWLSKKEHIEYNKVPKDNLSPEESSRFLQVVFRA